MKSKEKFYRKYLTERLPRAQLFSFLKDGKRATGIEQSGQESLGRRKKEQKTQPQRFTQNPNRRVIIKAPTDATKGIIPITDVGPENEFGPKTKVVQIQAGTR